MAQPRNPWDVLGASTGGLGQALTLLPQPVFGTGDSGEGPQLRGHQWGAGPSMPRFSSHPICAVCGMTLVTINTYPE